MTYGFLFQLKSHAAGVDSLLSMVMIEPFEIEREQARRAAIDAVRQPYWCGPRQVLFLHRDGFVELWQSELVDSGVDSGENRGNSKLTQPPEEVAHPLGVEPKTF